MRKSTHQRDGDKYPLMPVNVYCITNPVNGKRYVGITYKNIDARWGEHVASSRHSNADRALSFAIRKYGPENFQLELLEVAQDWGHACDLEKQYIQALGSFIKTGHGYNMTLGGDGAFGLTISPDTQKRMLEGNQRAANERAEIVRPAVESLMASGFVNYLNFAKRMNDAGIPTFRGGEGWGIGKVRSLLARLGYDTASLDRAAEEDRVNRRNVIAIKDASEKYLDTIRAAFAEVMATAPDSIYELARRLNNANVPPRKGGPWAKSSAKLVAERLGYDVAKLAESGKSKTHHPRKVVANHVEYESLAQAERITGDKHIVRSIRSGRSGYYYVDEGPRPKPPRKKRTPPTPVSVQGIVYIHAAAAGKALGIKSDSITNRCHSPNFPDHFLCDMAGNPLNSDAAAKAPEQNDLFPLADAAD